ncbi:MAG: methyltransferase domain-containing protein [Planctomycetaceae bacterium]
MSLKVTTQSLEVLGRQIVFDLPSDQEEMLALALDGEASGGSEWDPYWGLLWAAAPVTAELLLSRQWQTGLRSLEVGCGVGLAGIAGLMAGLDVTFTDHAPEAVRMAQQNAARNGFPNAKGLTFDWRDPVNHQFDFIFGSDILYDLAVHEPLLTTLQAMLSPKGQVWIGDAGRTNAPRFVDRAKASGWQVELRDKRNQPNPAPGHLEFRLIVLTRPSIHL